MAYSHLIPAISPTAGDLNDGSLIGSINQSNPTAVLMGESLISIAQVLRKDITLTGSTLTDVTTAATDSTTGDFNPFGTSATMSLGDAFYFRTLNNIDTHVLYAQVSTQGVGTWTMSLQEWNATTDQWETVTGLLDTSSGTGFSCTMGSDIGITAGDALVSYSYLPGNNSTFGTPTLTATGVTMGTVTENPATEGTTSTGLDCEASASTALPSAGPSSAAAVVGWTLSVAQTGMSNLIRIRETAGGGGPARASTLALMGAG